MVQCLLFVTAIQQKTFHFRHFGCHKGHKSCNNTNQTSQINTPDRGHYFDDLKKKSKVENFPQIIIFLHINITSLKKSGNYCFFAKQYCLF